MPFVEVSLGATDNLTLGWDTHINNFDGVRRLSAILDPAWATLMDDLRARGLLDSTLIVWMGEFGRTPTVNGQGGRDHWANAWTTVLAGGGIRGGQVFGSTSAGGHEVTSERRISVADFLATIVRPLGIDRDRVTSASAGPLYRRCERAPIQEADREQGSGSGIRSQTAIVIVLALR